MRIVVYGDDRRVGALAGTDVVDLHQASLARCRDEDAVVPPTLSGLIALGDEGLERAAAAVDYAVSARLGDPAVIRPAGEVRLHAPTVRRPRIAAAAGNYAAHTRGSQISRLAARRAAPADALAGLVPTREVPTEEEIVAKTRARGVPRGFWKDFSCDHGPGDAIRYPAHARLLDYEGEAAVVLGRRAQRARAAGARGYFWGITLLNDLSARGVTEGGSLTFLPGKNFDGSASIGPAILVGDFDPDDIAIEVRVNGELRQDYSTKDMIFSFAEYLEYLTRTTTLWPGDMISGGSAAGSAVDSSVMRPDGVDWPADLSPDRFLSPGDVVEISSEPIGTLLNRVVEGGSAP
jgi:2-keto-4-pentenoate hydratase/2-oxohepta-3-ene-1,7-dioic acid hydratase in catechol pathway